MIHVGDCLEVMRALAPDSVDSIVTDPPYGIGFMGKAWDHGVPGVPFWVEALRVAKPGAYLLAFGGTRTFHRLACAIEDAGWELRDTIMWVYASGFPKATDRKKIPEGWEGWNTALKPAWEPIIVARKPLIGTVAANLLAHGTGALNIDGCRVPTVGNDDGRWGNGSRPGGFGDVGAAKGSSTPNGRKHDAGRWPANVLHDGSEEVLAAFPNAPGQQGDLTGDEPSTPAKNVYGKMNGAPAAQARRDSGSAARFFAQHQHSDDDWLWSTLSLVSAAGSTFCLQNESVASALSRAATEELPAGSRCVVSTAPSTNVTASELRQIATELIGAIQRTASACWHGQQHVEHSQPGSHANAAVAHEPTGITTITVSHWKSDGSAELATFSIIATNSEPGAKDSAERIRYCAKASREDRNDGCDELPTVVTDVLAGHRSRRMEEVKRPDGAPPATGKNNHPTVKPTDLMRWLCRLVTPPGGLVLDPFAGSGSTGRGAIAEGMRFVGIELDPEYARIAEARIRAVQPGLVL